MAYSALHWSWVYSFEFMVSQCRLRSNVPCKDILLMRTLALCGNSKEPALNVLNICFTWSSTDRFCSITLYFLLLLESCSRLAVLIKTVVADLNFPSEYYLSTKGALFNLKLLLCINYNLTAEDESCVDFKHCLQPSSVTIYWSVLYHN